MTGSDEDAAFDQLALELGAPSAEVRRMLAPATRAAAERRRVEDPRDASRRWRRRRLIRAMGARSSDVPIREHVRAVERLIAAGPYPAGARVAA